MSVNRWKMVAMPVAIVVLAAPMLINCGSMPKLPGPAGDLADAAGGCPEMDSGDFASMKISGGAAVEGKVKGFLSAAADLKKLAADMEIGLIASCGQLGKDLGMAEADVTAEPKGGEGAKKVCEAVAAKVSGALKANAAASLDIQIDPPKCYADIEFMTKCFGDCGSPISGGDIKASCEGGKISGTCDAECKGGCTVDAGAECKGSCKASCSGSCDAGFSGSCGGNCDGKCDSKDSKGKPCAGKCDGKCDAKASGTCTGTCGGKCSGSCEMKAAAKCSGSCSGGCSAEVKAPKCEGEFKPPKVDPSCQINCAAKGVTHMKCDPPNVRIVAKGAANQDVTKLIAALQVSLPQIVKIQMGMGEKAVGAVAGLVKGAVDIKGVAASAGAKALVCIASAVSATAGASASLNVNVSASASVGGSVKGGT